MMKARHFQTAASVPKCIDSKSNTMRRFEVPTAVNIDTDVVSNGTSYNLVTHSSPASVMICAASYPRIRKYLTDFRVVTYKRVLDWMIRFIYILYKQLGTIGNRALSLIYTLSSSPLHTHWGSQSLVVVSLKRICNSLSLKIIHKALFAPPDSFLAISSQPSPTVISRTRPSSRQQLTQTTFFVPLQPLGSYHTGNIASLLLRRLVYCSVAEQWTPYYCACKLLRECVYRVVA
jgi:hypothetical protein